MNSIIDFFEGGIDWSDVIIGVTSSIIASTMFLFILFRVRPFIKISPSMACRLHPGTQQMVYIVKVINVSPFFKLYDVKASMHAYMESPTPNGKNKSKVLDIQVINHEHWEVHRFNVRHLSQWLSPKKKLKTQTDYAIQFGTFEDLKSLINGNKIIQIQIQARHPLSGFLKVKSEEYSHSSQIINGAFYSGNCFRITQH